MFDCNRFDLYQSIALEELNTLAFGCEVIGSRVRPQIHDEAAADGWRCSSLSGVSRILRPNVRPDRLGLKRCRMEGLESYRPIFVSFDSVEREASYLSVTK